MIIKYESAKFWFLAVLLISFGCYLFAQSSGTGTGGSAQNTISGSSGGSGNVQTNSSNFFTTGSTNTFNGFTMTSNLWVRGRLGVNTNISQGTDSAAIVVRNPPGATSTFLTLEDDGLSPSAGINFGNLTSGGPYWSIDADGSTPPNFRVLGALGGDMVFSPAGGNVALRMNTTATTMGQSGSVSLTVNHSTMAIPNGLNIGSGQLNIPVTGTVTNGSSFTSLNTIQATNIVSRTPTDLITRILPDVGSTNTVFGNGTGPMQTFMHISQYTNSPISSSTWTTSGVYTNRSDQRSSLNVAWRLPAAAVAGVYVTYQSKSMMFLAAPNATAVTTTNTQAVILGPGAIFSLTNILGSPVVIPDNTILQGL